MNEYDSCDGCKSTITCMLTERFFSELDHRKCPCCRCLVKGVCNKMCSPFMEYIYTSVKKCDAQSLVRMVYKIGGFK